MGNVVSQARWLPLCGSNSEDRWMRGREVEIALTRRLASHNMNYPCESSRLILPQLRLPSIPTDMYVE